MKDEPGRIYKLTGENSVHHPGPIPAAVFELVLQADYGHGHGWEDVCTYPSTDKGIAERREDLAAYRENAPEYRYRAKRRRATLS